MSQVKSTVCVSDIHGAFNTLKALLAKVAVQLDGQPYEVICLGDCIDRGPRSREVVEWVMTNKIRTVRANHEDLALAYSAHTKRGFKSRCGDSYDEDIWLLNGGVQALNSWGADYEVGLPDDVLTWMSNLPSYILIEEPLSQGRKLLASHTGYGLDADKGNWLRVLWGRHPDDGEFAYEPNTGRPIDDGLLRCFGHTRAKQAKVAESWAMIDTGAAYKGYGVMTAFVWPSRELIQQEYID